MLAGPRARGWGAAVVSLLLVLAPAGPARAERRLAERPAGGPAGTQVVLHGAGYLHSRRVRISAGRHSLALVRTDRHGAFSAAVRIPAGAARRVTLVARDAHGAARGAFHVSRSASVRQASEVATQSGARLRWTPTLLAGPGAVTLRGTGFARRARVAIAWPAGSTALRTNRRGGFAKALAIPAGRAGVLQGSVRVGRTRLPFAVLVQGPSLGSTLPHVAPGSPIAPPGVPPGSAGPGSGSDPVVAAAGDIACSSPNVSGNTCHQSKTAALISKIAPTAVLGLGDFQYETGTLSAYAASYDLSWGKFSSITYPTPGNMHDQYGGQDYYAYWSRWRPEVKAAGPYAPYSFDLGAWHIVSVPSGCVYGDGHVDCSAGGPIDSWLENDLAAHRTRCTLAFWHNPRWTTTTSYHSSFSEVDAYWRTAAAAGVDVVLNGDNHNYERYRPQDATGSAAPAGATEFVVGTGGKVLMPFSGAAPANRAFGDDTHFGVLKLTLHPASYDWQFVAEDGSVRDQGSAPCH